MLAKLSIIQNQKSSLKSSSLSRGIVQKKTPKSPYSFTSSLKLNPIRSEKNSNNIIFSNSVDITPISTDYIGASKRLLEQAFLTNNIPALLIDTYLDLFNNISKLKVYNFIIKEVKSIESGNSSIKSLLFSLKS